MEPDIDPNAEGAWRILRGSYGGDLRFEENIRPVRYVFDASGRIIAPVMVAMLEAFDTVLFVPGCEESALEALVTVTEIHEREDGAATDRWRIHHGEPDDVRWAHLDVDSIRHGRLVMDGIAFHRANPLADDEAAICRHMNQEHRDALRTLTLHYASVGLDDPVMVGIDDGGIDVRGRFGVVRVPTEEPMTNAEDARRVLRAMTESARAAGVDHG